MRRPSEIMIGACSIKTAKHTHLYLCIFLKCRTWMMETTVAVQSVVEASWPRKVAKDSLENLLITDNPRLLVMVRFAPCEGGRETGEKERGEEDGGT